MRGSWSQLEAVGADRQLQCPQSLPAASTGQGLLLWLCECTPGGRVWCTAVGSVQGWRQLGETRGELSCSLLLCIARLMEPLHTKRG